MLVACWRYLPSSACGRRWRTDRRRWFSLPNLYFLLPVPLLVS